MRLRPAWIRLDGEFEGGSRILGEQTSRAIGRKSLAARRELRHQRVDGRTLYVLFDEIAIGGEGTAVHRRGLEFSRAQVCVRLRFELGGCSVEGVAHRGVLFAGLQQVVEIDAEFAAVL